MYFVSLALGGINKKLYWSLETTEIQDHTPKLYHLSSISTKFRATEILCSYRVADLTTPFPFSQDDLYQANQPGNDIFRNALLFSNRYFNQFFVRKLYKEF